MFKGILKWRPLSMDFCFANFFNMHMGIRFLIILVVILVIWFLKKFVYFYPSCWIYWFKRGHSIILLYFNIWNVQWDPFFHYSCWYLWISSFFLHSPFITVASFIKMDLLNLLIFSKKQMWLSLMFSVYLKFQFCYFLSYLIISFFSTHSRFILLFKLWHTRSRLIHSFKSTTFLLGIFFKISTYLSFLTLLGHPCCVQPSTRCGKGAAPCCSAWGSPYCGFSYCGGQAQGMQALLLLLMGPRAQPQ